MYLCVAEAERMNMSDAPQITPDLFERLVPYAIALDVEEPWSKALAAHLRRIGERPGSYQPSWCSGRSSMVRSGGISNGLTTSLATSLATQSSGASMLSGGGSSGGGGGGGGVGGW